MTETTTFHVGASVTSQMIADQICSAIEGGSGYWLESFKLEKGHELVTESPWYCDPKLWSGDFLVLAQVEDEEKIFRLTPESLKFGLQWLASEHLWRIEQIINETGDAETGDVFLQACLLGEIVYG